MIAVANLKRKKGQSLMVGSIVTLSVLLLFTGLNLIREIETPFEQMYSKQRGSHLVLEFDTRIYRPNDVKSWWIARPEVLSVTDTFECLEMRETAYFNGVELSTFFNIAERSLNPTVHDDLRIIKGEPSTYPESGSVWIPSALANSSSMVPGDILEIPTAEGLQPFIVSAVIVDPRNSAPFGNPTMIWITPGELAYYFPLSRLNEVMFGVRLKNPNDTDSVWSEFIDHLDGIYSGKILTYKDIVYRYTAPFGIMAVMLIAFSVLALLVTGFTIYGGITSSILADFKVIGILRAQGFRPDDVRYVYQIQYFLLALVAVPIGLLAGIFVVQTSLTLLMSSTGESVSFSILLIPAVATLIVFLIAIYALVGWVARRAEAVQPADAIRYGAASETKKQSSGLSIQRLSALSVPLIIALKSMFQQRRRVLFLGITVIFTTLAGSLAVDLNHTFTYMMDDLALFGFDGGDVRVTRGGKRFSIRHEQFMEEMNQRDDVVAIATWDFMEATVMLDDGSGTEKLSGTLIDGDVEGADFRIMAGRNPVSPNETALAVNSAKTYSKEVGDSIRFYLNGHEQSLEVVGIYQSINNGGQGFRLLLDTLRAANPLAAPIQYTIVLADNVDPQQFMTDLEAKYGEAVDAQLANHFIKDQMTAIMKAMRMTNGFLAIIFLSASAIVIFNSTLMTIAENRQMFGILKTVGMTPNQLRQSVVYGVVVQAIIAIVISLFVWQIIATSLLSVLFSGIGLVDFPLQHDYLATMVMVPLILMVCFLSAWFPSGRLLELNPKNLIVE
ncbi:MAG TPA: FtsX-like permease family protein [Pseudomonadales bacterium]|nr:FtsX-like permease family protein [Pseudomonadales bacterium]